MGDEVGAFAADLLDHCDLGTTNDDRLADVVALDGAERGRRIALLVLLLVQSVGLHGTSDDFIFLEAFGLEIVDEFADAGFYGLVAIVHVIGSVRDFPGPGDEVAIDILPCRALDDNLVPSGAGANDCVSKEEGGENDRNGNDHCSCNAVIIFGHGCLK